MNTFRLLLATEWREQRRALIAALALATLSTVAIGVLFGDDLADNHGLPQIAIAIFGALAALVVGSDSFARDRAEGSEGWVLRLPIVPWVRLAAKTAFLLLSIVGCSALGLAVAAGTALLFGGSDWFATFDHRDLWMLPILALGGVLTATASTFCRTATTSCRCSGT